MHLHPVEICFRDACKEVPSAAYANHWIHRYPGKLIPHIPRYFLEKEIEEKSKRVLDPFCGSGTVLVEAMISGHNAVGIDINPLACFLSKVKTRKLDQGKLESHANDLISRISMANEDDIDIYDSFAIDYWFSRKVNRKLCTIKKEIESISEPYYRNFFFLVFSSIIRKASYADPSIAPACKSKRMREKIENGWNPSVYDEFKDAIKNALKCHGQFASLCSEDVDANIVEASSKRIPLSDDSIDLIITSPPYINAQKYLRSTRNEIVWLGLVNNYERLLEMDKELIGTERVYTHEYDEIQRNISVEHGTADRVVKRIANLNWKLAVVVFKFFNGMRVVIGEMHRVLCKGSKAVLVIGNNTISGIKVPSSKILTDVAVHTGFKLSQVFVDDIVSRGLMTKRNKTANIINREWVIVLQK